MISLDDYIFDVLMRDLVGHDRRPVSFLVYVWLAAEAEILVKVGENVKGGSSVIARIAEPVAAPGITGNISGRAQEKIKEDDRPA